MFAQNIIKLVIMEKNLPFKQERDLINSGSKVEMKTYYKDNAFRPLNEMFFIDIAAPNLLMDYVLRHKLWPKAETRLIKRPESEIIKAYIDVNALSPEAEVALIHQKNVKLIQFYISKRNLEEAAQIALVESGNTALIKSYEKLRGFWAEAKSLAHAKGLL